LGLLLPSGDAESDEEVLEKEEIDFPKAGLESTHVKFVKEAMS